MRPIDREVLNSKVAPVSIEPGPRPHGLAFIANSMAAFLNEIFSPLFQSMTPA
jgi:hypothetical protein